jgi:hypothetical protein
MSRYYDIGSTSTAQTVALDFIELQPGDDMPNKIVGCEITQSTEIGDAMEEMLLLAIRRGNTSSGSGGATTTANPVDANDAAYAGTAPETQNTTKATTAGGTIRGPWSFNVRVGFMYMWPLDIAPKADQGDARICVELVAAPADSVTWQPAFSIMEC